MARSASGAPDIRIDDVAVVRDGREILRDVTLSLNDHRTAVVGVNGSGKSTLARLLNALVLPTRGTVRVAGMTTARDAKRVRRQVGFVFQNPDNQIVMPIVSEDIAFGLKNLGLSRTEIATRTAEVLDRFELSPLADREAHTLSGGEKQMVALAAVLVMDPAVVVFDEPTTMLDLRNRRRLQRHIEQLEQRAIVVTHDLDMVEDYERVIVMDDARVAFDGPATDALAFYRKLCS